MTTKTGYRRPWQPVRTRARQWLRGTFPPPPAARFPKTISGSKILDQFGSVYLARTFSSWGMSQNLSNTDITTALTGVANNHFNGVTATFGGPQVESGTPSWTRYQNQAGQSFWTGTPWASSLGAAWGSVDWMMSEALRLGICVSFSLFGGTGGPGSGTEGAKTDWVAVTNTDMTNAGVAIANRYPVSSYPNLIWHVELDFGDLTSDPSGQRVQAFFAGVNSVEGSARPVRWMECNNPSTTNSQGWYLAGNFNCSINCGYSYSTDNVGTVEGWFADVAGAPMGDCESIYDGNTGQSITGQRLRYRDYAVFLEGGCLVQYGHEDWWPFGLSGLFSEGLTWQQVPTHSHTIHQKYCWDLCDTYVADVNWGPEAGTFVTTGTGTTTSKCAAGNSNLAAIAYFPNSRTIAVDTTILAGAGNVRLRWMDPTTGVFTIIASSEAQQTGRSVTYPGNNAAGDGDQVLVVDLVTPPVWTPYYQRRSNVVPHMAKRRTA